MLPRVPTPGLSTLLRPTPCARLRVRAFARAISTTSRPSRSTPNRTPHRRPGDRRDLHASAVLRAGEKDPYKVLGVNKDASAADIKKTYFSLARKYHPDTNPDKGAKEKFTEIQNAYEILKDSSKRTAFDQHGHASQQQGFNPGGGGGGGFPGGFGGFGGFPGGFGGFANGGGGGADFFEDIFGGGGRGRPRNPRGQDLENSVNLTFMEACRGATKTVTVTPVVNCGTCTGTGLKKGAKRLTCSSCKGTGSRVFSIDSGFQMASTCPSCQGTGSTVPRSSECSPCAGHGKVRTKKSVEVKIPPGIEDGMMVRVQGEGDEPIAGSGAPGDLLLRVKVESSKSFRRQGSNLYFDAKIPVHIALLGGKVRVPTLDGPVDVRVPGGTQHGEEMVLKGRGTPHVQHRNLGDLFVAFSIQLPRSLTPTQRKLLQQYADDVEGRAPQKPSGETGSGGSSAGSKEDNDKSSSSPEDEPQEEAPKKRATA